MTPAVSRSLYRTLLALIHALFASTYCVGTAYDRRILGLNSHIYMRVAARLARGKRVLSNMKRITYKDTGPLFLLVKDNEAVGRVCMNELIHVFCDERGER